VSARILLALLALTAAHLFATTLWLGWDEGVQYTDAAFHYSQVAELVEAAEDGLDGLRLRAETDENQRYGGLWYGVAAALSTVTGVHPSRLILGCAALLIPLLLFGAYTIGWELAREDQRESCGLLAAALVGFLPGIFNYSRVFVLDLALTASLTWAVVAILAAIRAQREHRDPRPALVGVWIAFVLSAGIKLNAVAFLAGPLWVLARPSLKDRLARAPARLVAKGCALGAAVLAAAAWLGLGPRGPAIRRTLVEATWPGAVLEYAANGALVELPGHYLVHLRGASWDAAYTTLLSTLGPPWCAVALAAFVWYFARRHGCEDPRGRVERDLAFWWFTPPAVLVIGFLRGLYDERYLLPLLPLVAAIVAVAALDLPRRVRRPAIVGLVLWASINFTLVSFPLLPTLRPLACATVPGWAPDSRSGPEVWLCALYPEYRFLERTTTPQPSDPVISSIERRLRPERDRLGRPLRAVFLDDLNETFYRLYQRDLFGASLLKHEDALLVHQCWDERWMTAVFETPAQVERILARADVVLMRYGTPSRGADRAVRGRRCTVFWRQAENFVLGGSHPVGDGTEVRFYLRVADVDYLGRE
jgi:hypothetical protein